MIRPRAADDFETIRARMDELRRQPGASAPNRNVQSGKRPSDRDEGDAERRRRERIEGRPLPWVPTIFVKIGGLD